MGKKPIVASVVVIAVLLFITIIVAFARPSAPAITVRHVKSVQSGTWVSASFEITNHTSHSYVFLPFEVEVRKGSTWVRCYEFQNYSPNLTQIPAYAEIAYSCEVTNLPATLPLRFKIRVQETLTGLNGFVRRVEINVRHIGRPISLNPFDQKTKVFGLPNEVVSEEFVQPVSPAEENSKK